MLLNFIATNEEALWVPFSDGNGTGSGALFLKEEEEEAASSWDIASFLVNRTKRSHELNHPCW